MGARETLDPAAPKRIDGDGSIALINAAADAGVQQFVLVSSLGAGKVGWPASVLNLFWGVLIWKRQAEAALEGSGMQYCIVRPGGMERPKDDYKETHNLVLQSRDTLFGGQVSNLQVSGGVGAKLAAAGVLRTDDVFINLDVYCKELAPSSLFVRSFVPSNASPDAMLRQEACCWKLHNAWKPFV